MVRKCAGMKKQQDEWEENREPSRLGLKPAWTKWKLSRLDILTQLAWNIAWSYFDLSVMKGWCGKDGGVLEHLFSAAFFLVACFSSLKYWSVCGWVLMAWFIRVPLEVEGPNGSWTHSLHCCWPLGSMVIFGRIASGIFLWPLFFWGCTRGRVLEVGSWGGSCSGVYPSDSEELIWWLRGMVKQSACFIKYSHRFWCPA